MMLAVALLLLACGVGVCLGAIAKTLTKADTRECFALMAVGNAMMAIGYFLPPSLYGASAVHALLAAGALWGWWRNDGGPKARKAMKELGDKSRARVRALVGRMTPSPVPSPAGGAA